MRGCQGLGRGWGENGPRAWARRSPRWTEDRVRSEEIGLTLRSRCTAQTCGPLGGLWYHLRRVRERGAAGCGEGKGVKRRQRT